MSALDDAEWEELLSKVKWQGASLDSTGRRHTMTQLSEVLGSPSREMDDRSSSSVVQPRKLRSFSGAKDPEQGVVDFATWCLYAQPLVEDKHLHDSECKPLLLESLLRPALEIATSLHSSATNADLFELLENHYGEVSDGFEMYTQLRSSIQEVKETATEYLQRLHLLALKTAQRGGMKKTAIPKDVVRQFENGCADEDLLQRVDVRSLCDEEAPLPVDELLLLVRIEESRRKEKKLRLKATNARANMLKAQENDMATEMASLQKKVKALTLQLQSQPAFGTQAASASSGSYGQPGPQPGPVPAFQQPQVPSTSLQRGHVAGGRGQRRGQQILLSVWWRGPHSVPRNAELVQHCLLSSVQWSSGPQQDQGNGLLPLVTRDQQGQMIRKIPLWQT